MGSVMRIVFLASLLTMVIFISVSSEARQFANLSDGGSIFYSTRNGKSLLVITNQRGRLYTIKVNRDSTISSTTEPSDVSVVGTIRNSVVLLIDTYPSVPGGMSYCQAGKERFLRIISMYKKRAVETLRVKVESCRENIELGSPGIEWDSKLSVLHINWL